MDKVRATVELQPLAGAVERFVAGAASANDVARAFLKDRRVSGMILTSALSKGMGSLHSDLIQDALVLFNEKYLVDATKLYLPEPESIYALIFSIGEGVVLSKRREAEQNRPGYYSLDELRDESDGEERFWFLDQDDSFEEQRLAELAQERAGKELERRLSTGPVTAMKRAMTSMISEKEMAPIPEPNYVGHRMERNVSEKRLSADQKELKDIRKEIGLTLDQYASFLGITVASLSAYIYGRTESVPVDVMESARGLKADHKARFEEQLALYEGRPMLEIVSDWVQMLGLPGNGPEDWSALLAKELGVTLITIQRWTQEKFRPTPMKLIDYGKRVTDILYKAEQKEKRKRKAAEKQKG